MNGKFVRLFEESLLVRLLKDHDPRLHVSDYVLGIPKNNLNPITRLLGNTYIELHPRNPVPNKGSIITHYNRESLSFSVMNIVPRRRIDVEKEVDLYSILGQINRTYLLSLTTNDVYNTSIKEFPNGKMYAVILARPESYRYTGKVEIEVNVDPIEDEPVSLELTGTVVSTLPAASITLVATLEDKV